jgi:hypothetical protein
MSFSDMAGTYRKRGKLTASPPVPDQKLAASIYDSD